MAKSRDLGLDVLKFIGIIGLIASHTFSNKWILQIRSFDVNLLVIISAYLAELSWSRSQIDYIEYCKKRFARLLLPAWIFITIYLVINWYFQFQSYSLIQITRSYLLLNNSIGYVWIIYVYLICALLVPFLRKIDTSKVTSKVAVLVVFLFYCALTRITENYWYQLIVLYPIIYGLISLVGIFYARNEKKFVNCICIVGISVFVVYAFMLINKTGAFVATGNYKYPPRLYYLGYSIGVSILLLYLKEAFSKLAERMNIMRPVSFVASHSLWIYFWHILGLQIALKLNFNEFTSFVFVMGFALILTFTQDKVVFKLSAAGFNDKVLSLFRG